MLQQIINSLLVERLNTFFFHIFIHVICLQLVFVYDCLFCFDVLYNDRISVRAHIHVTGVVLMLIKCYKFTVIM